MTTGAATARTLAALRAFARPRPPTDRCDLCGVALAERHEHVIDAETRGLRCACLTCARGLGGSVTARWVPVPRRVRRLPDLRLGEEQWQALRVPVGLAYFVRSSPSGAVVARYPSPGGPVQAAVDDAAWTAVVDREPALAALRPDTEAFLVNRTVPAPGQYLISIDEAARLVGLVRRHWRGVSGGAEVQTVIAQFFADFEAAADTAE